MGQPVAVVEKPMSDPDTVRFELNRSLTGMGHETYRKGDEITGERPPDVLARRLFERGGVDVVHIYSNVVTLKLSPGASADGISDVIEQLYIHYLPGVEPQKFD
ncbi:MAG: hypothetical protein QOG87_4061 [Actinomycetota bacterium]|jgi:hypothetical protein